MKTTKKKKKKKKKKVDKWIAMRKNENSKNGSKIKIKVQGQMYRGFWEVCKDFLGFVREDEGDSKQKDGAKRDRFHVEKMQGRRVEPLDQKERTFREGDK